MSGVSPASPTPEAPRTRPPRPRRRRMTRNGSRRRGGPHQRMKVTGRLRRLAPAFRKTGWTVDDLGRGGHAKQAQWRVLLPHV